jgi:hypothetical protein
MSDDVGGKERIRALDELRVELLRAARNQSASAPRALLSFRNVVVGGVAFLVVLAAAGILIRSDDNEVGPRRGPAGGIEASGTYYTSLAQLMAKSELVVTGTVQQVVVGEVVAEPADDEYPTRWLDTTLMVDEVLKGSPSDTLVVETLELAFGDRSEWRKRGERVLVFLSPSREEPGLFILSNDGSGPNYEQAAYMLRDEDVIAITDDEIAERVAALSLSELREKARSSRGN